MTVLSPAQAAARMRSAPPPITIGVPVFNGAALLDECLACLARQTRGDFLAVVSDNASTDATAEIAGAWAARDPRFLHVRQPENLGATGNFVWLRDAATSPFFMWRAHDDLSGDDHLARLASVLEGDPTLALAVGRVETRRLRPEGDRLLAVAPFRPARGGWRPLAVASGLRAAHQCWFYGLWRREALAEMFDAAWAAFPHGWGSDHLTVAFAALEGRIGGDDAALFIQRMGPPGRDAQGRRRAPVATAAMLAELRGAWRRAMRARLARLDFDPFEQAALRLAIERETSARVAPRLKVLRRRLKERLGLYPAPSR